MQHGGKWAVQNPVSNTHINTPSCVDGWGTHAQFGPDILGQYNTQLLSLITLARTIKPHGTIAHTSQGENLFSLLQGHLSPSWGHSPAPLGSYKKGSGTLWVVFILYDYRSRRTMRAPPQNRQNAVLCKAD